MGRDDERIKLLLTFATGVIECVGFAGVLYGWPSLVFVLKKEDYFADLCNSSDPGPRNVTVGCVQQDERFALIFTIGDFVLNFGTVACGFLLDSYGVMVTRFLGIFLYTTGTLMIAFSSTASALLLFPALALLGAGGVMLLTTNIKIGNLFGRNRATVITVYTGAFSSATVIFLLVKVAYEAGFSVMAIFLFISCLSVLHVLRTVFLVPWKHIPYPLPEGFSYGVNCEKDRLMDHAIETTHQGDSTLAVDQMEGNRNDRREQIEGEAGMMWEREEGRNLADAAVGQGRGEMEGEKGDWSGGTEGDTRNGEEKEQNCRMGTDSENKAGSSGWEGQKGECREVMKGDKRWERGEKEGQVETEGEWRGVMKRRRGETEGEMGAGKGGVAGGQGEWRKEADEKNGEVSDEFKREWYPEGRREEMEQRSEGAVETEGTSGDGREQPPAADNLQHNGTEGPHINGNVEEVPSFRSCLISRTFLASLLWTSLLLLRLSFFIGTLNPLLNLMTNADPEQGTSGGSTATGADSCTGTGELGGDGEERFKQFERRQRPGESAENYVAALRHLARRCRLETLTPEELTRDLLVYGLRDEKLRTELLRKPDLSFNEAMHACRLAEAVTTAVSPADQDINFASVQALMDPLAKYPDRFDDELGKLPYNYKIVVNRKVEPVVHAPHRVSFAIRDKVESTLHSMVSGTIVNPNEAEYTFSQVGRMLGNVSCCTNTFIYAATQSRFREQVTRALKYPATLVVLVIERVGSFSQR
ncbi:uncharacterized protein LOC116991088 [Amblyraja radiata]|uniref:uncharacterized protein LOC116991088 n=1 Tax=Amblyraja radiata TaxID=386614 RepID=UPI001401E293|nr:uncharacterized protein LOC116991088 [Amblyraja radiata]